MAKKSKVKLPEGWLESGGSPEYYHIGYTDKESHSGKGCGIVKSIKGQPATTGTLMQGIHPGKFLGKRIQLTAWLKSKNVESWAGLWLRIDTRDDTGKAFDNMRDRPIEGTTDWTEYKVILDVCEDAYNIAFGALLVGRGTLWVDDFDLKVVSKKVKTTDLKSKGAYYANKAPTNMDFST